ncbi:MAG TPA: PEP-CTERM sorting domain-containing protein [Acidobacteriaceae bacterium]|nr:PEP-CTERM sorting domain-containing protein [Acidobacteriaceae bacterium]
MKTILKLASAVVLLSPSFVLADTIQLGSYASGSAAMGNVNTAMNYAGFSATSTAPSTGTASSYTLNPGTAWGGPAANSTWVGYAPTAGPAGTSSPALGYYTFTTNFTAVAGLYSGTMSILADDTAEVLLNGSVLIPFGSLGSDAHCADGAPSCMVADMVSLNGLTLKNANQLTFVVQQAGFGPSGSINDPSGMDFDATLATNSPVPEPSSLALMAIGLAGLAGGVFGPKLMEARAAQQ